MTRDDRLGKRALFSVPGDAPDPEGEGRPADELPRVRGRQAFFSSTAPPPDGPDAVRPGTVVVECRACQSRTTVGLFGLAWALTPSIWLPVGRYNRWMRCDACGRRTWCRIDWSGLNPFR